VFLEVVRRLRQYRGVRHDPSAWARSIGVTIGERCRFLGVGAHTFGSEPYLITLGDHVTVTGDVRFVTHDGGVWVFRDTDPRIDVFGPIRVGNNVFIGLGVIILPGVTIGDNVVIGAGAVVNRDVPSDSVAAGVPARVVSTLADYQAKVDKKKTPTKGLSPSEKRAYLEKEFAR
jgi:acetyltransferase-like isoleucine patch superfamily enzyme